MKVKIFRWKAIGPLLLLFVLLGVLVWIFAEPVARQTTEEAGSELLGTEVNVGKLDLLPRQASVDLRALQIADPFVLTRNLIEADEIRLKLNPAALAVLAGCAVALVAAYTRVAAALLRQRPGSGG